MKTQRREDLFVRISRIHKTDLQKLSPKQQWLSPKTVKGAGTTFISNHFPSNQRRFKCVSSTGQTKKTMCFWIHPEMIYICPHGDLTLEPHAVPHTWLMTPPSLGPSMPTTVCSVTRFLSDGSRAVAPQKGQWKTTADWCVRVDIWHVVNAFGKLINHSLWPTPEIDSNTSSSGREIGFSGSHLMSYRVLFHNPAKLLSCLQSKSSHFDLVMKQAV